MYRKDRSPINSGYGSYKSGSGSIADSFHERSTDDELQSSVNSVNSIASSIASFASSIGIGSFNSKNMSKTPDPPYSSSIPSHNGLQDRAGGLKRVASSPSKLATQGISNSRKEKFGIGFLFKAVGTEYNYDQFKSIILEKLHIIETQAMECRRRLLPDDFGRNPDYETIINDICECFFSYMNTAISALHMRNLWREVHLGGLVGSRQAKDNVVDLICDLYNQYEGEKKFMSTVVTANLSANSTWHSNLCDPQQPAIQSDAAKKFLDLYGGPGSNFPVRIAFISQDPTLLKGFLALTSYFQRNTIYVKSHKHKKAKFVTVNSSQLSLSDFLCNHQDTVIEAVQSAISTGTFTLLCEEDSPRSIKSSDTTSSTMTSLTVSEDEGAIPRYSSCFVDYALSRKLYEEELIVPNSVCQPVLSSYYHPSLPVVGIQSHEGIFKDFKCGFSAFNEALKLSISEEVLPKMVINDATIFSSKVLVREGNYSKVTSSTAVSKILRNFVDLKELTGNSKLCLLYLESELQSLAYIRDAYLTFCQLEPSPDERFLDIFKMDKSDGEFFRLIKK